MASFDSNKPADNWDDFVPEHQREQLQPMSPEQVEAYNAPTPRQTSGSVGGTGGGQLRRFIGIPIVLVLFVGGWIANRGTTGTEDLVAGDCFVMPKADEEFDRLDTEECSAEHDGEIIGVVNLQGPTEWPDVDALDPYWFDVLEACAVRFDTALVREEALPADLEMFFFYPTAQSWSQGDRESLCYIYSPSGLNGSFING